MSYLEKLLDGVTVEWKPLGEIADLITTGRLNANAMDENGNYPFFTCNKKPYKINRYSFDLEAILISGNGSQVGHLNYYHGKFNAYQRTYIVGELKDYVQVMYIFHYLNHTLKSYITKNSRKGSVPYITMPMLVNFPLPIPCPNNPKKSLEIQKKIVAILDTFSELTAELTTELTVELAARKMQYYYYREMMYNFDKSKVQHLSMGDENIGKFIRGGGLQKKDFSETGVGCIHYGQIYTYYGTYTDKTKSFVSEEFAKKARMAKYGDLVIATTSETDEDVCKAVAWLGDKEIAVSSDACFYRHNLNPKYVAYFFQTEQFQKQKRSFITGTKVRRVNADDLAKIKIPVPSKEEQERIATILVNFDELTSSLREGLPKEIALRKKQYEYYREMLLTFPQDNLE